MAKAFTEEEKKQIRQLLVEKGTELFTIYGFKKTSIGDLTKQIGIAQGTFYQFFNSKEDLFFEILEIEGNQLRKKVIQKTIIDSKTPQETIYNIYHCTLKALEEHPLMKKVLFQNELDYIYSRFTPEQMKAHSDASVNPLLEVFKGWKNSGLIGDIDPTLIIGVVRSMIILSFHKDQVGEDIFPAVMEFLLERIGSVFDENKEEMQ